MFRCEVCSELVPPRTPLTRLTVETRRVVYPLRPEVHFRPPSHGGKGKWIDDPGGEGHEIVRELAVCPACVARSAETSPAVSSALLTRRAATG